VEVEEAVGIMQQTVNAMRAIEHPFHGILYGGFILTRDGPRLLEYNVRFGDPEAMNVLPLLEENFVDLCGQIMESTLPSAVKFAEKATVCKYVTPVGYGVKSAAGEKVFVDETKIDQTGAELYYASVDQRDSDIYTTTSRALAVVGMDEDIAEAERMSETALQYVGGNVFMRHDIGKSEPIEKRIKRMEAIRRGEVG
jgi:phosphoribosylamine--glycine ligase